MTYEEWLRSPTITGEVVNGKLVVLPPPRPLYVPTVARICDLIAPQLLAGQKVVTAATSSPMPDAPDVALFPEATTIPGLIVEVLTPESARNKREPKLEDYVSRGVPEVWFASPEAMTVEALLFDNGRLSSSRILMRGLLQPKLFPHVSIDIATIWPD